MSSYQNIITTAAQQGAVAMARWHQPQYKTNWKNLCAILPHYLDDGTNGTMILYTDGTLEFLPNRVPWVLDNFLNQLGTSKELLHSLSERHLPGKDRRRLPLVQSCSFTLVPVKFRKPIKRYDGTSGYFVLQHLQHVQKHGDHSHLLCPTHTIPVLEQHRTLEDKLIQAQKLTIIIAC